VDLLARRRMGRSVRITSRSRSVAQAANSRGGSSTSSVRPRTPGTSSMPKNSLK
jgi:hypothetical protein